MNSKTPKLCCNCIHYRASTAGVFDRCTYSPWVEYEPVRGAPVEPYARDMRIDRDRCGPEGKNWEALTAENYGPNDRDFTWPKPGEAL